MIKPLFLFSPFLKNPQRGRNRAAGSLFEESDTANQVRLNGLAAAHIAEAHQLDDHEYDQRSRAQNGDNQRPAQKHHNDSQKNLKHGILHGLPDVKADKRGVLESLQRLSRHN